MLETYLLEELKIILKEDYGVELKPEYLMEFGSALVSYGELLTKVEFGQSQNETFEAKCQEPQEMLMHKKI